MNKWLLCFVLQFFLVMAAIPSFGQQTHITFADNRAYITFDGISSWEFKPVQVGNRFGFDTGTATGAWGYTTKSGNYEIHPLFDKVCHFMHGYAPVKQDGQWGIINTSAEFVIEPAWEKVWSPDNNKETDSLVLRFSGDGVDSEDLYEVDPLEDWTNGFQQGVFPFWNKERWHLTDSSGNLIGNTTYERMLPMAFERAAVFADKLWGYLGSDGRQAIPLRFHEAVSFREGLAAVRQENLWGYIDISGKFVIPEQFERAGNFASGTAIVIAKGNFGIIDRTGRYLLEPEHMYINEMPEPDLFNVCSALETGLFHRTKGMILPVTFSAYEVASDGIIIAHKDNMAGIFDEVGNALFPMTDSAITSLGESCLLISKNHLLSIFDARQKKLIQTDYKRVKKFSDGMAAFQTRGKKWGFLDRQLQPAISASYTWVTDFDKGQAAVDGENGIMIITRDGKPAATPMVNTPSWDKQLNWQLAYFQKRVGVQDSMGAWRVRPEYSVIRVLPTGVMLAKRLNSWVLFPAEKTSAGNTTFDDIGNFSENRCWVKSGGKYGYLDENGKIIIPLQFDEATGMRKGMAAVKKDHLWGFINSQGKQLLPHVYTSVSLQSDDSYVVFAGDQKGYVTTDGNFLPIESEPLPPEEEKQ
ncbi:MAG: WG repeat-containing protein [Candidatus Riflebacteria bacterium]|nr:WG repeat-containing protein [Candidatus Riflebacteria bacterium]